MFLNAKDLLQSSVKARDGAVGDIKDIYFDDLHWTVRYLVVETGTLLKSRKVLLGPEAINRAEWPELSGPRHISVDLNHEQIQSSPDWSSDKPVSRQEEEYLRRYYGWPLYWGSAAAYGGVYPGVGVPLGGLGTMPGGMAVGAEGAPAVARAAEANDRPQGDPHLRSAREVKGYHIRARDGELGHVEDFLIHDRSWRVAYLVIDTRNWWPGRSVLVATSWVQAVSWTDGTVDFDVDRERIKGAPAYDPRRPLPDEYLAGLHDYYGRAREGQASA